MFNQKGKYGLVVPKKPGAARGGLSGAIRGRPTPPATRAPNSAFSLDDDDSDDQDALASKEAFNAMLQRPTSGSRTQKQVEQAQKAALEKDPTIFGYDEVYDDMQVTRDELARAAAATKAEERKKPRYIDALKKAAEVKKQEQDRYYERRLAKERKDEDEEFKDKEVFVTSAYKKKLQEMKKWDMIDRIEKEAEEKRLNKAGGMDSFLSHLLTNNIALGADVKKAAKSAYTVGSVAMEKATERKPAVGGGGGGEYDVEAEMEAKQPPPQPRPEEPTGPSSKLMDDRGATQRRDGAHENAQNGGETVKAVKQEVVDTGRVEGEGARAGAQGAKAPPGVSAGNEVSPPAPAPSLSSSSSAAAAVTKVPKEEEDPVEAKRKRENAVRLARERFLQRKKARTVGAGDGGV